ncbi:hypothetical protein KC19_5G005100 [Ceratodon purpureus]|uniref:3'-5' exonuclease domain-containing protein n=1 Tax=Ceratodon purpureus TaxID=3225 RepID=A0A8T0HXE7_CERPU|nr:hypothetical protein KC19_5G005100 [Ceratodon purpureus]
MRRFTASNATPAPGSSVLSCSMAMADDHHAPPLPVRPAANCAMSSTSDPPPPPPPSQDNTHNTLDVDRDRDRKKAERAQQRKQNLELKAARAREYEERWRERCAQDVSEDTWASGWKQPLVTEEYGGWDYTPTPVAEPSSLGMHQYPSWKRKLHSEQLDRNYGGWDQPLPSSSEEAPLGGWLYPDPSEPLDDYQTEVEILGKKVMVTVASKGATVERWLEGRKEAVKWGLDIEWRPTFQKGDYHYAALLQLSLEECCLLVQLQFIDTLPVSLKRLLADPNIMMGGVGVLADTNKLKNDYDLICAGEVELTTLAVSTLKNTSLKKSGIATLTEKVLGVPYKKNKRATMSNWEIRDLTYAQIQYAAADAWLSYTILMALLNYKEIPAAAPPALRAEKISSGNLAGMDGVEEASCS